MSKPHTNAIQVSPLEEKAPSKSVFKTDLQNEIHTDLLDNSVTYSQEDNMIEQYLLSYAYLFQSKSQNLSSYSAITKLGCHSNKESGENSKKETQFLDIIRRLNKYQIQPQMNAKGDPVFYHVYPKDNKFDYDKRLYLNIKRKHVADFCTCLFLEKEKNEIESDFYFKFGSDKSMSEQDRSESIVMYLNDDNLTPTINILEAIKEDYPYVLEGAENTNPFLNKIDNFIAYAPEPSQNYFVNKNNEKIPIQKSYNNLLSYALDESLIDATKEYLNEYPETKSLTDQDNLLTSQYCCQFIPELLEKHGIEYIHKVKDKFYESQTRNKDIYIPNHSEKENMTR